MTGKNEGVVGSIVEKVGRWIEKYEEAVREERELEKQLRQIERLLKETENAAYVIDVTKLQQQKKENEEKLKAVKQKRLKLEWLAGVKIKRGEWNPEFLKEYEFIKDLCLLNEIRRIQVESICGNCNECSLIRVSTPEKNLPLDVAVKSRGLPYLPLYKLIEIRENKLKEMELRELYLGALSEDQKREVEKRIAEKLVLSKNILNSFLVEKRVPLDEKVVLKNRKYGCHRKLPRLLPLPIAEIDSDSDPRAPDHFSEDITAEVGEDGSYTKVYISSKHGSEESE
jgi:hypothetical protein